MKNSNLTPIELLSAIPLTSANSPLRVNFTGSFIHCQSADEEFLCSLNNGAAFFPLNSNRRYRMPDGERFDMIMLKRTATAAVATNSVVLVVGDGDYLDQSVAIASMSIAAGQTVRETAAGTLDDTVTDKAPVATGGASGTLLIAASTIALRKGVKVKNTGTVPLRIGGTTAGVATGTRGDYLAAGESCFYPVAGALYAAGVGGVGACAVVELLW